MNTRTYLQPVLMNSSNVFPCGSAVTFELGSHWHPLLFGELRDLFTLDGMELHAAFDGLMLSKGTNVFLDYNLSHSATPGCRFWAVSLGSEFAVLEKQGGET